MSIRDLITFVGESNIADILVEEPEGELMLGKIAHQVCEDAQRDVDSMSEWSDAIEDGRELAKFDLKAKSEPWQGASNFKSTAITEAAIAFGDRVLMEALRHKDLVKTDIIGKDLDGAKKAVSERVSEHMNYQINYKMLNWREHQEGLLYELPATGLVFKKTYYDSIDGVNRSDVIHYPDFAINAASPSVEEAKAFTEFMDVSKNEALEKIAGGIWSDVELYPENEEEDAGSNEAEGVDNAEENPSRFLEQYCWYDIDEDGYAEPYVITVHEQSKKVVRIVARYDLSDVYVKNPTGMITPLTKAESPDATLVKIKPRDIVTKYGFIKNPDGTILDIGYYQLLGSMVKAINSITNQLTDAGTLSNLQGGFLARGFRKRMGDMRMKPGQWSETQIPAQELQTGMMPYQFKEPSPTLLALNEKLEMKIKEIVINLDLKGMIAPNAPASTTLALIQESMLPSSAIITRIVNAMTKEFQKLAKLNAEYTDPQEYGMVNDGPFDYQLDYLDPGIDVKPTANPEMSSKIQRIQLADAMLMQVERIALTGGDIRPIMDYYFDAIGADEVKGQVYPDPNQMDEEQAARMEAMQEEQETKRKLLAIEIDHKEREVAVKEGELQVKLQEAQRQADKHDEEIAIKAQEIDNIAADTQEKIANAEAQRIENAAAKSGLTQILEEMANG